MLVEKSLIESKEFKEKTLTTNVLQLNPLLDFSELFSSIIDAKKTILNFKQNLSSYLYEPDCLTPLQESNKRKGLFYKREDLTSIKAYKVRGALYQMKKIADTNPDKELHFVAASTGNHALGVLKSAEILKVSAVTICVPTNITLCKKESLKKRIVELNLKGINAKLMVEGKCFEETNLFAKNISKSAENNFYIDPYNTHNAVAGQGTIGLEILSQLEKNFFKSGKLSKYRKLTIIVPIGGGGLISGVSCAIKEGAKMFPLLRTIKLNIVGISLESLDSEYGDAIKVESLGCNNKNYIKTLVNQKETVTDFDMKQGMDFVKSDLNASVEGASAGTLKPILQDVIIPSESHAVVCLLSGGNVVL